MSVIYQVFVDSSQEDIRRELNKKRLGRANIVYGIDGKRLKLSTRSRLKSWEEETLFSIPGIVNIVEE